MQKNTMLILFVVRACIFSPLGVGWGVTESLGMSATIWAIVPAPVYVMTVEHLVE
jgi:hypothetical protein